MVTKEEAERAVEAMVLAAKKQDDSLGFYWSVLTPPEWGREFFLNQDQVKAYVVSLDDLSGVEIEKHELYETMEIMDGRFKAGASGRLDLEFKWLAITATNGYRGGDEIIVEDLSEICDGFCRVDSIDFTDTDAVDYAWSELNIVARVVPQTRFDAEGSNEYYTSYCVSAKKDTQGNITPPRAGIVKNPSFLLEQGGAVKVPLPDGLIRQFSEHRDRIFALQPRCSVPDV